MIDLFTICTTKAKNYIFDQAISGYELMQKVIEKVNEVIGVVNDLDENITSGLESKEDSINITNSRKLDNLGNFTGTWFGDSYSRINSLTDSNEDKIDYLTSQFSDGQTGFVVDGGFFEETGIARNFNGGVF